jgi:hypothetical protein
MPVVCVVLALLGRKPLGTSVALNWHELLDIASSLLIRLVGLLRIWVNVLHTIYK